MGSSVTPASFPDLEAVFRRQREAFEASEAPGARARRDALRRLREVVVAHTGQLASAIDADFGHRSRQETIVAELVPTVSGIDHAVRHVARWMRSERRPVAVHFRPGRARIVFQPLGVVGIISPWNYPVYLSMAPLTAALAAGNRAMLKPSELTPRTSSLLHDLLGRAFAADEVAVVMGGPDVGAAFASLPFDHLLFTGSTPVGRLVMRAAAERLVPVTLELGGKSPVIVDRGVPFADAARSIAYGKLLNAGQTCIAPDYVLVPAGDEERFASAFVREASRLFPTLAANPDYSSIIGARHLERLRALVDDARSKGARIIEVNPAGERLPDDAAHKAMPVVLIGVTDDMQVMQEEIFGPILPIVPYRSLDDAIAYVNGRARPLALYLFTGSTMHRDTVLDRTHSGGVTVNDTLLHIVQDDLPFGGVGTSGIGAYHGRDGFLTFSHRKAVFEQSRFALTGLLLPPYGTTFDRVVRFLMRRA